MAGKSGKVNRLLGATSLLLALSLSVNAAQVSPTPATDVRRDGTATGSDVVVLQDGSTGGSYRVDCTLQNNSASIMYYAFGVAATTLTTQLAPGAIMKCNNGVTVSSQALHLLGTSNAAYALSEQFVRGQ